MSKDVSTSQTTGQEEVTLGELIDLYIRNREIDLHTALPARVESYNSSAQTVDVSIVVNRLQPDGSDGWVSKSFPKLSAVPVMFPRGALWSLTWPVTIGDTGMLVFSDRPFGTWRATASASDPNDVGMHTLDGAVFVPGLFADPQPSIVASSVNLVIGSEIAPTARIEITPTGINLGASAIEPLIKGTTHNVIMTTWMEAMKVWMDAVKSYATGIQPIADPGDPTDQITTTFNAATDTVKAATAALESALATILSLSSKTL